MRAAREHAVEIGCGLGALLLYAATACHTVFVGDGGELIVAAQGWGVAHPPGYPLWTLLAKLALSIPLGEPAFRTAMLSAVLGATSCAVAAHLARRLAAGSHLASAVTAALLAAGRTFWSASTVTEVYTAHLLLVLGLLWAADLLRRAESRPAIRRAVFALALLGGVGLAHQPTIVLVLPAAALLAWPSPRRERSKRSRPTLGWAVWAGAAASALAIPVLAYGSLLVRARFAPEATWNHWTDVGGWWTHVTAAAYRPFDLGWGALLRADRWTVVLLALWRDLGPVGAALAVAGALGRLLEGRVRGALALLLAAHVGFALRYGTEDVAVYLLAATAALALLAGGGASITASWCARLSPRALLPAGAAIVVAVLAQAAWRYPAMDLRNTSLAADYARDVLASAPRGGVLVVDGDNAFLVAYLTRVLGERPDLTLYDRGGHVLRDLVPYARSAGREAAELAAERGLMERVRRGEIALAFLSWPGYDPEPGLRFRPRGLVHALERDDAPAGREPELHAEAVARQAARSGDLLARTLAASYPVMRGERALFEGDPDGAEGFFREARALAGDSETVRNTLGTIYGRRGELERARIEFEAALRAKPASPRAAANLEMVRKLR